MLIDGYTNLVYEQVSEMTDHTKENRQKYGSMAHRLPALVHSAGLAQALSFVDARGNEIQKVLLDHLAQVVGEEDREVLLRHSREDDLDHYMFLTEKVLLALSWYKHFAQSILEVESGEDTNGGDTL